MSRTMLRSIPRILMVATLVAGPATASAQSSAADLRTGLNQLFQEHIYLAGAATGAALGGRNAEFTAAAGALDANSMAIAKAVGSVYGTDAEAAFLPLWRRHIGFVVDYTTGLATKDGAKQQKAVNELLGYTNDLAAFLSSANPNLGQAAVAELVKGHILSLKAAIDAQAAGDQQMAYAKLREAAGHMQMVGDPIAAAIAKQFPQKFAAR
jgi:hypothetical protein